MIDWIFDERIFSLTRSIGGEVKKAHSHFPQLSKMSFQTEYNMDLVNNLPHFLSSLSAQRERERERQRNKSGLLPFLPAVTFMVLTKSLKVISKAAWLLRHVVCSHISFDLFGAKRLFGRPLSTICWAPCSG